MLIRIRTLNRPNTVYFFDHGNEVSILCIKLL